MVFDKRLIVGNLTASGELVGRCQIFGDTIHRSVSGLTMSVELLLEGLLVLFAARPMAYTLRLELNVRTRTAMSLYGNVPEPFRHAYHRPFHPCAFSKTTGLGVRDNRYRPHTRVLWQIAPGGSGSAELIVVSNAQAAFLRSTSPSFALISRFSCLMSSRKRL